MNIFTNVITVLFWLYTRYANTKYKGMQDPATGEKLNEKNKISLKKCLELPWTFWLVILFTAFQTSTAVIFSANSTELAEQRFKVSSVTAGWYSAMSQYLGESHNLCSSSLHSHKQVSSLSLVLAPSSTCSVIVSLYVSDDQVLSRYMD